VVGEGQEFDGLGPRIWCVYRLIRRIDLPHLIDSLQKLHISHAIRRFGHARSDIITAHCTFDERGVVVCPFCNHVAEPFVVC
jgi:hypothetical protein